MKEMSEICFLVWIFLSTKACLGILYHSTFTDMGIFVGKIENASFKERKSKVIKYLGIPYASSQAGLTRFQRPFVSEALQKPYNATYFRPACSQSEFGQPNIRTSEDCLFLNIYAPVESTINPTRKYPVLIYLHGGRFRVGSAQDVSPENLSFLGDVIVVTVNFRTGVFGFLTTGDEHMPGNYGLWDQHLALKWIRFNIASFGGDFERITLIGQDSGASGAILQAMYPGNRGLFHKVIAMSGAALNPWALREPTAQKLGKYLGCFTESKLSTHQKNYFLSECLREAPASDILSTSRNLLDVGPTIDNIFLTEHPYNILFPVNDSASDALQFFRSLDVVIGTNDQDGQNELISVLASTLGKKDLEKLYIRIDEYEQVLVPRFLESFFEEQNITSKQPLTLSEINNVRWATLFKYTNWTDPEKSDNIRNNLLRLSSDLNYVIPAIQIADSHSFMNPNRSTYMYQFSHKPSFNTQDLTWITGAGHGSETPFVFGFPAEMMGKANPDIPKEEINLAENMVKWISNFAKMGNPNKPFLLFDNASSEWANYDENRRYLKIQTNLTSELRIGEPYTSFWLTLVPVLIQNRKTCKSEVTSRVNATDEALFTALRIPSRSVATTITVLLCVTTLLFILLVSMTVSLCRLLL